MKVKPDSPYNFLLPQTNSFLGHIGQSLWKGIKGECTWVMSEMDQRCDKNIVKHGYFGENNP